MALDFYYDSGSYPALILVAARPGWLPPHTALRLPGKFGAENDYAAGPRRSARGDLRPAVVVKRSKRFKRSPRPPVPPDGRERRKRHYRSTVIFSRGGGERTTFSYLCFSSRQFYRALSTTASSFSPLRYESSLCLNVTHTWSMVMGLFWNPFGKPYAHTTLGRGKWRALSLSESTRSDSFLNFPNFFEWIFFSTKHAPVTRRTVVEKRLVNLRSKIKNVPFTSSIHHFVCVNWNGVNMWFLRHVHFNAAKQRKKRLYFLFQDTETLYRFQNSSSYVVLTHAVVICVFPCFFKCFFFSIYSVTKLYGI